MTANGTLLLENPLPPDPALNGDWQHYASLEEDDTYDDLLAGLRSGRFGGVSCDTAGAVALVEVLRLVGWPINYRQFAGSIAHYPEEFGLTEARASLRILGFSSEIDRIRGANLAALPSGSFVISHDNRYLFLQMDDRHQLTLLDPQTNRTRRLKKRKIYDCLVVTPIQSNLAPSITKASWIGRIIARFGAENRILFALTFLSNTLIILASLSVGFIFDQVLPAKAFDTLIFLLIGVGLLLFFDLRMRRMKSHIIAHVSGRLEYIVSNALYEKLITFRLEMLRASSVSEQINRLKQFETVRDFFCGPIVAVFFEAPFVILLMAVIFYISTPVGILLLGILALYLLIGLILYPHIKRKSNDMLGLRSECMRLREETINQRAQIVRRGLGEVWANRLAPSFRELSLAKQRVETVWRILNTIITVVSPLAVGGVILIGSIQVMEGNMTGGGLIACMILASRMLSPVQQALVLAVRAPEISNLFKQIDMMMQIPNGQSRTADQSVPYLHRADDAPSITINNLVLRYPRSVSPALKGLSLRFDGGTLTCLTGASGSGKSSLLAAMMGHYRVQSGSVLIGTANVEQFDASEKTDWIGYLGHRSLQIHGTLAQNLRLTRPEATDEQLAAICNELGILNPIMSLPDGFETRIDSQFRFRLSSSFRTKFAIAQLLLKEPKVLLLDEPETGLSNDDEQRLMNVIRSRAAQMTTVMVTHRPSLVRQADRALVLKDGQVQFYGPPNAPPGRS